MIRIDTRWAAGIALVAIAIGLIFALGRCSGGNERAERQAEQTTRSSEAVASAAADAVSTLEGRTATERNVDEAVREATKEIHSAQTVQAVHRRVMDQVCDSPAYASDPACVRH